ncbi:YdbH domain-containing protein [Gallaecimonas sp. GXIMD4217]|uniref:YdbH domain-containing protein n=1 Tax=Gallaecimonas sp. GXIMD4217 TaxID=3131927 RepID=UPI00311AC5C3
MTLLILLLLVMAGLFHWLGRQGLYFNGITLWPLSAERLRLERPGCDPITATALRLESGSPLLLFADQIHIPLCDSEPGEPLSIPALPAFRLQVRQLHYGQQPPLALALSQELGRFDFSLRQEGDSLNGQWHSRDGQWLLDGSLTPGRFEPRLQGALALEGSGLWRLGGTWQGQLTVKSQAFGSAELQGPFKLGLKAENGAWQAQLSLPQPWPLGQQLILQAGPLAHARGQGQALQELQAEALIASPWSQARLSLRSQEPAARSGSGQLTLEGELSGQGRFQWQGRELLLEELALAYEQFRAHLVHAVSLPLDASGQVPLPLTIAADQFGGHLEQGLLSWQARQWQLDGVLALSGQQQGVSLEARLPIRLAPQHYLLRPWQAKLIGPELELELDGQEQDINPDAPELGFELAGRYRHWPLRGHARGLWQEGAAQGQLALSTGPLLDRGGEASFQGDWQWRDEVLALAAGSRLTLNRGLKEQLLVERVQARLEAPLTLDRQGLHGQVLLEGRGLVLPQWRLPRYRSELTLDGTDFAWRLQVPDWATALTGQGQWRQGRIDGDYEIKTELVPAISQGLPVVVGGGSLGSSGRYHWSAEDWSLAGELVLERVEGFVAASQFRGLDGRFDFSAGPRGERLHSRGPVSLDSLDPGIPLGGIRAAVRYENDALSLTELDGSLLSGRFSAPRLDWPAAQVQEVRFTGLALADIVALQSEPVLSLDGKLDGTLPVLLGRDSLAVVDGHLVNSTPVRMALKDSEAMASLSASNVGAQVAFDSLGRLDIDTLEARLDMADDGQATLKVNVRGQNPDKNNLPVILNYRHEENLRQLLRSLRIGEDLAAELEQRVKQARDKP